MTLPFSSRRSSDGCKLKVGAVIPVFVTRFSKSMNRAMRRSEVSVFEVTSQPYRTSAHQRERRRHRTPRSRACSLRQALRSGIRRKGEMERAALPGPALCPHLAAVGFDDALRDEQPEPHASPVIFLNLPEALEDAFELILRDARAGIADGEPQLPGDVLGVNRDTPAFLGKF